MMGQELRQRGRSRVADTVVVNSVLVFWLNRADVGPSATQAEDQSLEVFSELRSSRCVVNAVKPASSRGQ